jgi:predicted phosphodiesterase
MRIAVFADIHGNPYSTRVVLDAISDRGVFDAVVMAGDVCSGGSDPCACVDMLLEAGVQVVYGNADEFIFASPTEPPTEAYRARWPLTTAQSQWAAKRLGQERVDLLRSLPFELRFSPTANVQDDLLVVHGNPKNTFAHILPPEEIQEELFGEVRQKADDPALLELLGGVQAAMIVHGHFHYTSERVVEQMRLVNVSPCSSSRFDTDRRARFSIFTWDGEWDVERVYLDYDLRREGEALMASDMPGKESQAEHFRAD